MEDKKIIGIVVIEKVVMVLICCIFYLIKIIVELFKDLVLNEVNIDVIN